ncbi:MAG TPA: hypothetical protein DEP84_23360, partial [Chloroflexi bacterium]|nr:hypothetical protein [Chloroflexota bacterium]
MTSTLRRLLALFVLALVAVVTAPTTPSVAQNEKSLYWEHFDVTIDVLDDGDLRVTERNDINFTSGTFTFGYREIPTNRVTGITDVTVVGDGRRFDQDQGSRRPYTFYRYRGDNGEAGIRYYFPQTSGRHTFILSYIAQGALRYYSGGDQLWWKAVYADRPARVEASTITVNLPGAVGEANLKAASYGEPATSRIVGAGRQVTFTAGEIPAGREIEVRVQFPHGIVSGRAPAWQAAEDRRATLTPVLNLLFGALGLLVGVGGLVGSYVLWYTRGRDVPVALQAEYLSEPPDDLPPGVVGTLLDEKADTKDIIATLVDLARRGAIRMEEQTKSVFLFRSSDYSFYLEDRSKATRPFEQTLIRELFGSFNHRDLSDLKQKFYRAIPGLQSELYEATVDAGLFPKSPQSARTVWRIIGFMLLGAAVGGGFLAGAVGLVDLAGATLCLPAGLALAGIALLVVGQVMPRKTARGAEAASKWRAFERYLRNIDRYGDLERKKEIWDQYLAYAIALGVERDYIRKFARVDAPVPAWYGPYGWHAPYGYGYYGSSTGGSGTGGGGGRRVESGSGSGDHGWQGPGGLQGASDRMSVGLQNMSDGLINMINSAGTTFTSTPPSSSSGGGWSGGGGGGGDDRHLVAGGHEGGAGLVGEVEDAVDHLGLVGGEDAGAGAFAGEVEEFLAGDEQLVLDVPGVVAGEGPAQEGGDDDAEGAEE